MSTVYSIWDEVVGMPRRHAASPELEAAELKAMLGRGESVYLLDVRTPAEFADWRIHGASHAPIEALLAGEGWRGLPRDRQIVTICARGSRSRLAAEALRAAGYRAVSLAGGMAAWSALYDLAPVPAELPGHGRIVQVRRLGKGCLSYLVLSAGVAAVVDPSARFDVYQQAATEAGVRITHVLDTHQHADHVSGARRLAEVTGATLYLNPRDGYVFDGFLPLEDGAVLAVGKTTIRVRHAPGHTRGSTLLRIEDRYLLTGDTLFVEGVGRPDLRDRAAEFADELYATYRERLHDLPDDLQVLPGHHGPGATFAFGQPLMAPLGALRQVIHLFHASRDEFIRYVTTNLPDRPANTREIVRLNREGTPYDLREVDALEEGANRCAVPAAAAPDRITG
jgi:glyoxylase-like metal-dependent hydrolase (beta-lactamase superfamily II)/rhodanese-related sulfurtransferase